MTARTWISNAIGMRISRPGYNVVSATPAQRSFDSDNALPWLYASNAGVAIPSGVTGTLNFPVALPEPPIPYAQIILADGSTLQLGTGYAEADFGAGVITWGAQMRSFVDKFELYNGYADTITIAFQLYRIR